MNEVETQEILEEQQEDTSNEKNTKNENQEFPVTMEKCMEVISNKIEDQISKTGKIDPAIIKLLADIYLYMITAEIKQKDFITGILGINEEEELQKIQEESNNK